METIWVFVWVWAAMVAMSFWESSAEGRKAWAKGKVGWKLKVQGFVFLTRYHFSVWVMWSFLVTLPFVLFGWNASHFVIPMASSGV